MRMRTSTLRLRRAFRVVGTLLLPFNALCLSPALAQSKLPFPLPPELPILAPPSDSSAPPASSEGPIRTNSGFSRQLLERNDDESGPLVPIGFTINFFGRLRSALYVNNNGNVTLDAPLPDYTPFGLTGVQREIIAAFFADVDTRSPESGVVTYGYDTIDGRRAFGVNYINVGYYNSHADKLNRFQLVLIERADTGAGNFDIEFNYEKITWETGDASGGVNGFGGTPAAVGWSNGSGLPGTSFELPGSLTPGAFLDSGPQALIRKRIGSTVFGRLVFRARDGQLSPGLEIRVPAELPSGTVGTPYMAQLSATGATPPYRWTLIEDPGRTAGGLALSAEGILSGTPSQTGEYEFTLQVESQTSDGVEKASQRVRWKVKAKPPQFGSFSCPLPPATVGYAYSYRLPYDPGSASAQWNWTTASGDQPVPGLRLTADGTISGTPQGAGTFPFELFLVSRDPSVEPVTRSCTLLVVEQPLRPALGACPEGPAIVGVPYAADITPQGGAPPFSWLVNGILPLGLALDSAGKLRGVPAAAGWYEFELVGTDRLGQTVTQKCGLSVKEQAFRIATACPLPAAVSGETYTVQLAAQGGAGPYRWRADGGLPGGFTLSPDGLLSGRAGAPTVAHFLLVAEDSAGDAASIACALSIEARRPAILSCPLPAAQSGEFYQHKLEAVQLASPMVWSGHSLPPGMAVSATGFLSGIPQQAGEFPIELRVRDATGRSASSSCTWEVKPPLLNIETACPLPEAAAGVPYRKALKASGGYPPYTWSVAGAMPGGLSLQGEEIAGRPVATGDFAFTLVVRDGRGFSAAKQCKLASRLPGVPTLRLSGIEDPVHPASGLRPVKLTLDEPYPLDISGVLVLEFEAQTGNETSKINRADPAVLFLNGRRETPFVLYAGQREFVSALTTSGTVAGRLRISVKELEAAGVPLAGVPAPIVSRVERKPAILTGACWTPRPGGLDLRLSGYTTTRNLTRVEVFLSGTREGKKVSADVRPYAQEYFESELSVRTGGAFQLTVPVWLPPATAPPASVFVDLYNEVGAFGGRAATQCP